MADSTQHAPDPVSHVGDGDHFEIFDTIGWSLHVPAPFTKFMLMEIVAAVILLLIFIPFARRVRHGGLPKGRFVNLVETLLMFIQENVAKDAIGHGYKAYVPYLWTTFFFILTLNLLGMVPFLPSATAEFWIPFSLAVVSFFVVHISGLIANHGPVGYIKTFIPHIEMDDFITKLIGPVLIVGIFVLEIVGAFIRGGVLAIRLFANMFGGHLVLFVILTFIHSAGKLNEAGELSGFTFWGVTIGSVLLATALSLLEILVAFVQAFVFTFLTATFIGMAKHPEH